MPEEVIRGKRKVYEIELSRWAELVREGTSEAFDGLSRLTEKSISLTALNLKVIPAAEASYLVGGPENEVVAIYLAIAGEATGHIMLVYPKSVAFGLVDMLLNYKYGTTQKLGEMESSVLSEVGNITGSFFLNSIANNTGMTLMPTPPSVMVDMAGAILDIAVSDIMKDSDELFVMSTVFATREQAITGALIVLPTADFMEVMMKHNEEFSKVW